MGHCHKRAVRSVDANRVCGPRWCRTGERQRPDAVAGEESQRPQLTTIHASPPVLAGSATDGASRTRSARFKGHRRQIRHQRCPGHCERFNLSPVVPKLRFACRMLRPRHRSVLHCNRSRRRRGELLWTASLRSHSCTPRLCAAPERRSTFPRQRILPAAIRPVDVV